MTGYRIQPAGVLKVLKTTQAAAAKLGPTLKPLEGDVQDAATACNNSGAIVPALQAFFTNQSAMLTEMERHTKAALEGAYKATSAYVNGDHEMVLTYERNAPTNAAPPPTTIKTPSGKVIGN